MADDRFYVKTLRMQNFRCFENVELGPFDPHFNLLVGGNGAGKSSVLVALAAQYRKMVGGYPVGLESIISHRDIKRARDVSKKGQYSLSIESIFFDELGETSLSIKAAGDPSDDEHFRPLQIEETDEIQFVNDNGHLLVSYDVRRLFGKGEYKHEYDVDTFADVHPAFEGWLDPGVDSSSLRSWMKDQTLRALQAADRAVKRRKKREDDLRILQLEIVKDAVISLIDSAIGFEFDSDRGDIALLNKDDSNSFFREMSAGERAFIGLFADIARRACLLNAQRLGAKVLTGTTGLVLIDEIDLHLHPKWQRQIVPALKRIFPKIQFFATTHSPQVIGEAKPEEIVLLTPQGQKRPAGSFGMDSNWILECVMEAEGRDPEIGRRIKLLFDLIEADRLDEAKAEIRKLREQLPAVAPDIVSAEAYIWNLEHGADEAAE